MFATVVSDIYLKTLVAIFVIFKFLGQCEMSIYPGEKILNLDKLDINICL